MIFSTTVSSQSKYSHHYSNNLLNSPITDQWGTGPTQLLLKFWKQKEQWHPIDFLQPKCPSDPYLQPTSSSLSQHQASLLPFLTCLFISLLSPLYQQDQRGVCSAMAMATKFFAVLLFALIAISMLQTMVKNVCAFVCVVFQLAFTLYLSFFKYYDFLKQWFVLIFPG